MATRIARLGLYALLLAVLGPLCAQGAERVQDSVTMGGLLKANVEGIGTRVYDDPESDKWVPFNGLPNVNVIRHGGRTMTWVYNDANRPGTISQAAVLAQINASMAKWTAVCNISFVFNPANTTAPFSLTAASPGSDGVNVIGWVATGISAPTTGITNVSFSVPDGIIGDAEIRLNAAYSATVSAIDATLTHEIGHAIGLDHSDFSTQVMSGPPLTSYTGLTALQSDDITGCQALYGAPGAPAPLCVDVLPSSQQPGTCPAGQTGSILYHGNFSCVGTAWTFNPVGPPISNTCTASACVGPQPPNDQQTLICPAGQTGSILQSRSYTCVGTNWTPGAYQTTSNTCTAATDTQAPTVPTGLTATVVSSTAINLTWTASTDNVGVTGYKVFMNGSGTPLGTVTTAGASITLLSPSTTYSFTVSACDAASHCSAQSAPVSATTQAAAPSSDTQAPTVPIGLTATVVSSSQVNLAWTASTDNVAVTGYKVYGNGILLGTVTSTGASVIGLTASTTYSFTVSACDAASNCSAQSAQVSATTQAAAPSSDTQAPTVPAGLTAMAASSSQINLSWTASTDNVAVTAYKVFQNGVLRGTVSIAATSITGLSASTTYSFNVSACDAAGNCSAQSAVASVTTLAAGVQPDYTGAWYDASESGWGLSVVRGPLSGLYGIIMYHYNQSSSPTWYWMSGGSFSGDTYSAPVSLYSGPYFGGAFNPALVSSSVVGFATINFTSATTATITYTINGITVTKNITKLDF
jgi:chitodextrinase